MRTALHSAVKEKEDQTVENKSVKQSTTYCTTLTLSALGVVL